MKKSVAILIPTLEGGGAEKIASTLSLHLSDEFEKYIILFDGRRIDYPYKGKIIDLKVPGSKCPVRKLFSFFKRVHKVRKIKRKHGLDAVISLMESANMVNILSKGRAKVIASVHIYVSKNTPGFYGKIYRMLIRLLYNRADTVITVSEMAKRDLVENFRIKNEKLAVVYNPHGIDRIQKLSGEELEAEYKELFENPVIINAGRLTRQKGQWHLIRAFRKVREKIPGIKLVFLGAMGELGSYLETLSEELGIKKDISFLGFHNNPYKFFSKSALFVLSSLFEGYPNVLIEALACGVPIISVDCKSGPREILAPDTNMEWETTDMEHGRYGVLSPVCDGLFHSAKDDLTAEEEVLARSIIQLYYDDERKNNYIRIGKERACEFFIERSIDKYERILGYR